MGRKIKKRRSALVLSKQGYSKLTQLVVIVPITNANNHALRDSGFLVPVDHQAIDGFVNPFQFYTDDYYKRHAQYIGILGTSAFVQVKQTILDILN